MSIYAGPNTTKNDSSLVLHLDAGNKRSYPGSGTVWYDLSGNRNHGTLTNGPTFSAANGGSIIFDGLDDYVNCGSLSNFLDGNQITMEIVTMKLGTGTNADRGIMISIFGTYIDWNYQGKLLFSMWNGNSQQTLLQSLNNTPYNINVLNHTVVVFDGTRKKLYNNSELLRSTGDTGPITSLTSDLNIGRFTEGSHYCNGRILIARVYNRALSHQEIKQNYNATRGRFGL